MTVRYNFCSFGTLNIKSLNMKRYISFFLLVLTFGFTRAQDWGLHAGYEMFSVFNNKTELHGITLGLDKPRSGFITPYGRISVFNTQKASLENVGSGNPFDFNDPFIPAVQAESKVRTFSLEFGTKYYLGGAYDYGFSGLFFNSFRILLMPSSWELIDFDATKYEFQPINPSQSFSSSTGYALTTNFGGGLKYSFDWGSLYALGGLDLALIGDRLPPYFSGPEGFASSLSYSVRIGFRRSLEFTPREDKMDIRENNRRARERW